MSGRPNSPSIPADRLAQVYYALEQLKVETGAFEQLTRKYMENNFNPSTPDVETVRYVCCYHRRQSSTS